MRSFSTCLAALATTISTHVLAAPIIERPSSHVITNITHFPSETFIENIAVRPSGQLLINQLTSGAIYEVYPSGHPSPTLIATVPSADATLGFTEIAPDVFTLLACSLGSNGLPANGSYSVWELDLTRQKPCLSKITDMPGQLLNGMTLLDEKKGTVLISDTYEGIIWKLDTKTGEHTVVLNDTLLEPASAPPAGLGVNGIQIAPQTPGSYKNSKTLYFANTGKEILGKVEVNDDGSAAGDFQVVADSVAGDDFTFDSKAEYAFVMLNAENTLLRVRLEDGTSEMVAGGLNSTLLPGPTSCKFGKGRDKDVLFVTNSGATHAPIDGYITEPGSVVRVELAKLGIQS